MVSELDALRTAKILLDKNGAPEAWRILLSRAVREHDAGQVEARGITLQVLAALEKLTAIPDGKPLH